MTGSVPKPNSGKTAVGVFLKYPHPGRVKTRLAATVGNETAARIYLKMVRVVLQSTLAPLDRSQYKIILFCDPLESLSAYEKLFPTYEIQLQAGQDLGARLINAFAWLLQNYSKALVIGTDCTEITSTHIELGSVHLKTEKDVVFGPAKDGGYYLIGMQFLHPQFI